MIFSLILLSCFEYNHVSAKRNPETHFSFLVSIIVSRRMTVGQFGIIDKNFTLILCKREEAVKYHFQAKFRV